MRAMSKYLVLFMGLIWACLMLVSWSGSTESRAQSAAPVTSLKGY